MLSSGAGLSWGWRSRWPSSFGFSSTVLAAKVLEGNRELRAVHGRVAIGILIVQDVVAVVAARVRQRSRRRRRTRCCCCCVPFARPAIAWLLERCGHGELLVLFGAALAIGGGEGFEALGLSAELGALLLGTMLADHKRAQELTNVLWGLKELFLVGFFLNIGFSGPPTGKRCASALWLVAVVAVHRASIFFLLLIGLGLRARTSFLTAVSLTTYSEFALIVVDVGRRQRLAREPQWVVVTALAVALSFVAAAPFNAFAHELFRVGEPVARASRARQAPSRRRADLARPRRDPHRRHGPRRLGRVRLLARSRTRTSSASTAIRPRSSRTSARGGASRMPTPRTRASGTC